MKSGVVALALASVLTLSLLSFRAEAQFKDQAFSQSYNDDKTKSKKDTVDKLFSFKEYFGGLAHRNTTRIGTLTAGSFVFIGGSQIYNKQYWKLPIIYGGIAAGITGGILYSNTGHPTRSAACFAAAGVVYWGSLLDGVVSYKTTQYPHAGKATLYSLLLPGLGQIYNGEYWKVPIYVGLLGFGVSFYANFNSNYERWRRIYNELADPTVEYKGPPSITADQALYYRNYYRRYRDYFLLGIAAVYVLQIIDANVFAYMHNFDVSDDLSLSVTPTVLMPETQYALNPNPAFGLRVGFTF